MLTPEQRKQLASEIAGMDSKQALAYLAEEVVPNEAACKEVPPKVDLRKLQDLLDEKQFGQLKESWDLLTEVASVSEEKLIGLLKAMVEKGLLQPETVEIVDRYVSELVPDPDYKPVLRRDVATYGVEADVADVERALAHNVREEYRAAFVTPCEASLLRQPVSGPWYVDGVRWDGFSDQIRVVLNNGLGGWREFMYASDEVSRLDGKSLVADIAAKIAMQDERPVEGDTK